MKSKINKREWNYTSAMEFLKKRGVRIVKDKPNALDIPWGTTNLMGSALDYLANEHGYVW